MKPAEGLRALPGGLQVHQALAALHADTDVAYNEAIAQHGPVQCKPGCSACCNLQVTVMFPEAVGLVLELCRTEVGREKLARSVPQLHRDSLMLARGNMDDERWHARQQPCVFLTSDKMCGVYPVRPNGCRGHGVWSSRENCATPGGTGQMVNTRWLYRTGQAMKSLAEAAGLQFMSGPLQFSVLMACFLVREGVEAFLRRVQGTPFEDGRMASLFWVHLEGVADSPSRLGGLTAEQCRGVREQGIAELRAAHSHLMGARGVKRVCGERPPPWSADDFRLP